MQKGRHGQTRGGPSPFAGKAYEALLQASASSVEAGESFDACESLAE